MKITAGHIRFRRLPNATRVMDLTFEGDKILAISVALPAPTHDSGSYVIADALREMAEALDAADYTPA